MDNKNFKEDDYLVTSKYAGRERSEQYADFCAFEHESSYYFAWIDDDGAVAMRSEAYSTAKARDNGIQSVIKNRSINERWAINEFSSKYFLSLKAGNHQEIAKSPALNSKEEAESYLLKLMASSGGSISKQSIGIAGAAVTGKIISETRKLVREDRKVLNETRKDLGEKSRKEIGETRNQISETRNAIGENRRELRVTQMAAKADDYLPCSQYKGHKVSDKKNNVALFKHKDGQLYFAIYNDDGSVRLRSEGFQSAEARKKELSEALKYIDDTKRYESIDKGEYHIKVLKNEAGQEVGRTCLQSGAGGLLAGGMLAVAAMSKSEFVPPKKKEKVAYLAGNGGCLKFWPLLLLLPLLWFCWKGCGVVPPPAAPVVVEKVVPPPPVEKVVPPPVVPKTCDCSKLTHPIFVIPDGPPPKETTILGRAPEYGNSHALDAPGFYNKLKRKYNSSAFEKDFLNGIFKQMGYENGFSDATADLFSEVTVPRGVDGNLGTKVTHKTVYRKLNTNGKDLLAFRIKAKNACDLHFMKTCGNHFFYNECHD